MEKIINNALKNLENADYVGFFDEIDKIEEEFPSDLKTLYHTHKTRFAAEGAKWDFTQQLTVFAKLIHSWGLPTENNLAKSLSTIFIQSFIKAIQPYHPLAKKIMDYVQKENIRDWASQEQYAIKAREILTKNFSNVIGVQINHLIAIGRNNKIKDEEKIIPYIKKCLFIPQYTLDLISFAFISRLWDLHQKSPISFNQEQKQVLRQFFERSFGVKFLEQITFLKALYPLFGANNLPFPEMKNFQDYFKEDGLLYQSCLKLQELKDLPTEKYTFQKCLQAEIALSNVMSHFSFLIQYNMISIKNVNFKFLRNTKPHFIHNYIELGFDQKANIDVEKHHYSRESIDTDTVLMYKGEEYDKESINLFPFVIDFNALNMQEGQLICFFQSVNFTDDNILEYAVLKDDSIKQIDFQDIKEKYKNNIERHKCDTGEYEYDWDELVGKKDNLKKLNLDHIILQFQKAKKDLTVEQIEKDDEFEAISQ